MNWRIVIRGSRMPSSTLRDSAMESVSVVGTESRHSRPVEAGKAARQIGHEVIGQPVQGKPGDVEGLVRYVR